MNVAKDISYTFTAAIRFNGKLLFRPRYDNIVKRLINDYTALLDQESNYKASEFALLREKKFNKLGDSYTKLHSRMYYLWKGQRKKAEGSLEDLFQILHPELTHSSMAFDTSTSRS